VCLRAPRVAASDSPWPPLPGGVGGGPVPGLALRATDADWSHGTGPEVSGPVLALVMAMTGRKSAASQLSGEGVALLQARP
jgi:hypothetical protein